MSNLQKFLKVFGTIKETQSGFGVRVGKIKRKFAFDMTNADENDRKKRAKTLAETFLVEKNTTDYFVNTYKEVENTNHCIVQVESNHKRGETPKKYELLVDSNCIDTMRDRVWWCREKSDRTPMYIYCAQSGKRLQLVELLFNTTSVHYRNGNVLDCRRQNVVTTDDTLNTTSTSVASTSTNIPNVPFQTFERFFHTTEGFFVPQKAWLLCKKYASISPVCKKILVDKLSQQLFRIYPELPLPHFSHSEMMSDLLSLELSPTIEIDADNILQLQNLMPGHQGLSVCKQFYVKAMSECGYNNGSTMNVVKNLWEKSAARKRIIKTAINSPKKTFNAGSIWSAISLSYYAPANFSPLAARQIYQSFAKSENNGNEIRVLDFCMGWGGRFLGFWISNNVTHYTGIDINPRVHRGCNEMIAWLQQHCPRTNKTFDLIEAGAETNWQPLHSAYDLVFTSPPYFKRENYEPDNTEQSCNKYSQSYQDWLLGFLKPSMIRAAAVLRPGGYFIMNVADTALCPTLVRDTRRLMQESLGLTFLNEIRLPMPRRPSNKNLENYEPVLCAKK